MNINASLIKAIVAGASLKSRRTTVKYVIDYR